MVVSPGGAAYLLRVQQQYTPPPQHSHMRSDRGESETDGDGGWPIGILVAAGHADRRDQPTGITAWPSAPPLVAACVADSINAPG